jgi:hypothetical protein
MNAKKQAPKKSATHLAKKKPAVKKTVKKLSPLSAKLKRKQSTPLAKKSKIAVKKRTVQKSITAKKKTVSKVAGKSKSKPALKAQVEKPAPRKQSAHSLRNTIADEVQKALQHSVLPLIENLMLERNKPEKTIHAGVISSAVGGESLLNLLIVSVSKLQDTIERFSTSIEHKLIQPNKPPEVKPAPAPVQAKPAEVKPVPAPAPAPQAQAPATPSAPQAPAQAKPPEVKPAEVKPVPAPAPPPQAQAQAPAAPPAPQAPAQAKPE